MKETMRTTFDLPDDIDHGLHRLRFVHRIDGDG